MADDTRQPAPSDTDPPRQGSKPERSKDVQPERRASANIMPGGTMHTAGGERQDPVTIAAAVRSVSWSDWAQLPTRPCVKDSLLTGIGAGFALGGLRAILAAPIMNACNWAVGGFCFSAFSMYQYCLYQRRVERDGVKKILEVMDRKAVERKQKEQRMERARELRRQKKEEEDQETFARLRAESEKKGTKSWWKMW